MKKHTVTIALTILLACMITFSTANSQNNKDSVTQVSYSGKFIPDEDTLNRCIGNGITNKKDRHYKDGMNTAFFGFNYRFCRAVSEYDESQCEDIRTPGIRDNDDYIYDSILKANNYLSFYEKKLKTGGECYDHSTVELIRRNVALDKYLHNRDTLFTKRKEGIAQSRCKMLSLWYRIIENTVKGESDCSEKVFEICLDYNKEKMTYSNNLMDCNEISLFCEMVQSTQSGVCSMFDEYMPTDSMELCEAYTAGEYMGDDEPEDNMLLYLMWNMGRGGDEIKALGTENRYGGEMSHYIKYSAEGKNCREMSTEDAVRYYCFNTMYDDYYRASSDFFNTFESCSSDIRLDVSIKDSEGNEVIFDTVVKFATGEEYIKYDLASIENLEEEESDENEGETQMMDKAVLYSWSSAVPSRLNLENIFAEADKMPLDLALIDEYGTVFKIYRGFYFIKKPLTIVKSSEGHPKYVMKFFPGALNVYNIHEGTKIEF